MTKLEDALIVIGGFLVFLVASVYLNERKW